MVAINAIVIPTIPYQQPAFAVSCLESPAKLIIKRIAAIIYAAVTNPKDMSFSLTFSKHCKHTLRDFETAEDINACD